MRVDQNTLFYFCKIFMSLTLFPNEKLKHNTNQKEKYINPGWSLRIQGRGQ